MINPLLHIENINNSYEGTPVLRGVSFDVYAGEIVGLLGPSGCGKSTLLNIIAGLEHQDSGLIVVNGADISNVPVHRRDFGFMFQELALFPHKNVRDNVAFGLRMAHLPAQHIRARVGEVLELVGLSGFELRDVNDLSGGEQQRVALARSLAPHPRLLMLDEPLSSLDRTLRERLMDELRDILKRVGQTAIYVTHDQQEAFTLADRIVIMNQGQVAQIGVAEDIYRNPANTFVAAFLGYSNLLRGHIEQQQHDQVVTPIGRLKFTGSACRSQDVTVLIRPEAAHLLGTVNPIDVKLLEITYRGRFSRVRVRSGDTDLAFEMDSRTALPTAGAEMRLYLDPDTISCIP
jgi:ABC-type Fe3+/spermidine/putrescine transport system ATPase subunit